MAFLTHRQKLIKLADRSESGWAVVDEYDADALADNSEDERKIEKAEKAAEKKLAKRRKVQEGKQRAGIGRSDATEAVRQTVPAKIPVVEARAGSGVVARTRFAVGTCFRCGDPGHFQRECPKVAAPRAEYPLISVVEHVGMEGGDAENVAPCMQGDGANLSPEEDKSISNMYRCGKAQ